MSTITPERAPAREETTTALPTRSDIFTRAADLLEEFGWTMGHEARDKNGLRTDALGDEAASFCLWGALRRASYDLSPDKEFYSGMYGFIASSSEVLGIRSAGWNDSLSRNKGEVVGHLRDLAKRHK